MAAITVVGSVNLDLVASVERLPRPGETVTSAGLARYPGGKGANQALAARRAGADVRLVAAVGNDTEAALALALLDDAGVDLSHVRVSEAPTGTALIAVEESGENQIIVSPGANHALEPGAVEVGDADLVLCQLEVPMGIVEAAARATTGMFCLNPAPALPVPDFVLERADLLIVNESERDTLADSLSGVGALVVVTLGAAGAKAYRSGRLVTEAQPPPVEPIDTVGAGDAFCGALVVALLSGHSVASALKWACAAGALATTKPGAQPSLPTAAEIEQALSA